MLLFLKLGGSLITDKAQPRTARLSVIQRLSAEIASALKTRSELQLILGHGSGSFGHSSADQYQTRDGVSSREQWKGFARVWWDAASLNHLVMEALHQHNIPAAAFPPSSSVFCRNRTIREWSLSPLLAALEHRLIPVVYGDVCFDDSLGGTILSTEELFAHLARKLQPDRILLAGEAPGVWADYPHCTEVLDEMQPGDLSTAGDILHSAEETDVTGGMESKIRGTLELIEEIPTLDALVFSGTEPGILEHALSGGRPGTHLHA
jgi:isopentenyl phosphate kinase